MPKLKQAAAAECEATLQALLAKRDELIARGEKLPELRRNASYAAHVEQNAEARDDLDSINAEISIHASELASIDDAIATAKNHVLIAQAQEADVAARARAKEAVTVVADFKQAGIDLDQALRAVGDRAAALMELLHKLHQTTGVQFPSADQVDTLGFKALETAIQRTPWRKRFRPVAPGERREFGALFAGWVQVIEGRLQALISKEAA
jgi:hypothetical protein